VRSATSPRRRTDEQPEDLARPRAVGCHRRASRRSFGALILAANIFSVLTFYSVLKVIRDALILTQGGAEVKSYSAAGQAMLALAFVPAYAWVAARVDRMRLIAIVTLFFALNLVAFAVVGFSGGRIGVVFFIWAGLFNLVMVAQFWAFANDIYTPERGKRLFPLVGVGQFLGAVAGASVAVLFARVSPYVLMLFAAVVLLLPLGLILWSNRRERKAGRDAAAMADAPLGRKNGFRLVFSDRYLFLIAMLFVVLNLVNTLGQFLLDRLILEESLRRIAVNPAADQGEIVRRLTGGVQLSVNILGFILQTLAVSRIFKLIGVRGALFILPVLALEATG
jgi:AAA family ATP:ADP antiporter